jgi:hypothetical protein
MANISQINGFEIYAQTASLATTASFASTASLVNVIRGVVPASSMSYVPFVENFLPGAGTYEQLYTNNGAVFLSGSILYTNKIVSSFTGSLLGTASLADKATTSSFAITSSYARSAGIQLGQGSAPLTYKLTDANGNTISSLNNPTSSLALTASYINPTFISASAAASGFGSGGGGTGGTDLGLVYAVSLGYLMP